ncbi:MAG: hypothetical protein GEU90_13930 [Gemmatimonas sp.]|nr:hypothetical protein [Gemmatimonas sp.]
MSRAAPGPALALGATLTLTGCGDGTRIESTVAVRDSAGVTIVESEPGGGWPEGEGWRLSDRALVDIGVFEGDEVEQLHDVTGARRLSDGRIVVANAGTHELRFYASDGSHIQSVGRQGGGPGEFQQIDGVDRLAGDTISVWDSEGLRLSFFAPDGEFVRSVSPAVVGQAFGQDHYGTFGDGSFVLRPGFVESVLIRGEGLTRDTTAYTRYDGGDGVFLDTIAVTPGREVLVQPSGDLFSVSFPPFGRASHLAVHGDHAYVGVSDRFEIRVVDSEAVIRRIIRLDADLTPVTDADVRRYAEANAASRLAPEERDDPGAVRAMVQTMLGRPRPETFPMFDALVVDDVGVLWVRESDRPGSEGPEHWIVFDTDGRLLGTVQMPRGFQVFQIGPDFVLGHARDDLDIEHIRMYELIRSPA